MKTFKMAKKQSVTLALSPTGVLIQVIGPTGILPGIGTVIMSPDDAKTIAAGLVRLAGDLSPVSHGIPSVPTCAEVAAAFLGAPTTPLLGRFDACFGARDLAADAALDLALDPCSMKHAH